MYRKELIAIDGTKSGAQNAANKAYNKEPDQKLARIYAYIGENMEMLIGNDQAETAGKEKVTAER